MTDDVERVLTVDLLDIRVRQAEERRYRRFMPAPRVLLTITSDYSDLSVWEELTPDQAEQLAAWLREVAAQARELEQG